MLDQAAGPGQDTSFANAALLTPSMTEPWNAPGSWRVLLGSLGRSDAALQLRLRALPTLAGWGLRFLWNSRPAAFERNTLSNLRLALYSREVMHALRQQTNVEYGRAARGTLRIFRNQAALEQAAAVAKRRGAEGLSFRRLSPTETIALEPALAPIGHQLVGALHYPVDEVGDGYRFCVALADHAREQGMEFRFRTEAVSLEVRAGRVTAVVTGRDRLVADRYIVAAGSYSTPLLRRVGVRLPVRPAKGYSLTFDDPQGRSALRIPVIDDELHAAVVPLESALRVAGTAEFADLSQQVPDGKLAPGARSELRRVTIDVQVLEPPRLPINSMTSLVSLVTQVLARGMIRHVTPDAQILNSRDDVGRRTN